MARFVTTDEQEAKAPFDESLYRIRAGQVEIVRSHRFVVGMRAALEILGQLLGWQPDPVTAQEEASELLRHTSGR